MNAVMERLTAAPGTSFRANIRRQPRFPFQWHAHPEHELTLITAGAGRRFVGDAIEPYQTGDLVLVGPQLPHTWLSEPPGPAEAVVIQFRRDFLGPQLWHAPEFASVADLLARARRGLAFPNGPTEPLRALIDEKDPARRAVNLLHALVTLARAPAQPLASGGYAPHLDDRVRRRVDAVCRHLAEHHAEPVTLAEATAIANLTPAAFCRFFRRATGHTLTSYLTQLRISAARRQLVETDHPIAQIAADCGFANLSHFNRVFRRLTGCSPREFRHTRT
ncbi:MAG: helix-turn-helix domain-containing protein [Micromonosporaceae bacterium]|nr:helix-turn-helix domain-containing protein [Micromonosporaceae bacterium]